jgi:hypothetical protein
MPWAQKKKEKQVGFRRKRTFGITSKEIGTDPLSENLESEDSDSFSQYDRDATLYKDKDTG